MNELALFAGAGGGILGGKLLGWRTVCAVEINAFCARRLMQRQNEGHVPPFPIWDDVRTFNGRPWTEIVDVVSGGFPCQDISCQGSGQGIAGPKSSLWFEMSRIISEVRPTYALVENSPILTSRGLGIVLGDLAEMGYDARWGVLGAADAGAPHFRKRIWIVAYSDSNRLAWSSTQTEKNEYTFESFLFQHWPPRPGAQRKIPRMANGLANRMDRLKAIGNGQIPAVVKLAWQTLTC